jgi:hypothetical protein
MNSPVAHWGSRELRKNLDDLVRDPERPQTCPLKCPMDLTGKIRVWLAAEDGDLVAYGFGGQRIALSAKSVGEVHTVSSFRTHGVRHGPALLVLDHERRILLRASGRWETYGELAAVCRAAKLPTPTHLVTTLKPRSVGRSVGRSSGHSTGRSRGRSVGRQARRNTTLIPRFTKAPGYRKVRVRPRGTTPRVLARVVLFLLTTGLGAVIGVLPALALPEWFGAVRTLIGIAGVVLGMAGGIWAGAALSHAIADALRWAVTSWAAGTPAPGRRFFRRRERSGAWSVAGKVGVVALVAALIGWGPGVGIASLVHGQRDASLVAELRAQGVSAHGLLIDDQQSSTGSDGDVTVTDVPTLSFLGQKAADPSIGGRPLPLNAVDPAATREQETVVFLPSDPQVAAAKQQITGSVWHGAPTANLITGGLFTLALPPLLWLLVLRYRRLRGRRAKEMVEDLTG